MNPIVANNKPAKVDLNEGEEYYFCACGRSANQLKNFFEASVELMQVMARACGHDALKSFNSDDLATWHRDMALLSGVKYSGFIEP